MEKIAFYFRKNVLAQGGFSLYYRFATYFSENFDCSVYCVNNSLKPCCYMLKSEEAVKTTLVPLGQECMQQYYHAYNENDITDFIKKVVIEGIDPMKDKREEFVKNKLMVNYPHAAEATINMIKKELGII